MGSPISLRRAGLLLIVYVFFTDAVKSSGYGLIFGKQWAYGKWPDSWKDRNISFLEFFPIVIGLSLWCKELQNKRVLFITDNESIVCVITNKQQRIENC